MCTCVLTSTNVCVCVCVSVCVCVCVCVCLCVSERKCGKYGMNRSLEEIRMNGTVKSMICYLLQSQLAMTIYLSSNYILSIVEKRESAKTCLRLATLSFGE